MQLFPYQKIGVETLLSKTRFLLRDEPGLGKTCQLVTASRVLDKKRILIICPKSMCLTWEREIVKWGGDLNNYTIINHDRLIAKESGQYIKKWDIVIADESHMYLKNINTQRAKAFFSVIEKADRVWLATATVASKSGEDYYCTLKILLPTLMKSWSRTRFIKRFCQEIKDPFTYSGVKYEGFQNMEELQKIFSVCSLKRTEKEVCLELPELTETDMPVDIKGKDLDKIASDNIISSFEMGAEIPIAYQTALRELGLSKIDSLIELLQTYPKDKKVVIFAWHREVISELVKRIPAETYRGCNFISGEVTCSEERQRRIDNFQEGPLNTLVLNMQSGGAGITLTAATVGIYLQFPHSVIHWVQSRKRIHRIGSKKPVQIIKLISKGSVDEKIFKVLSERAAYIKEIEG